MKSLILILALYCATVFGASISDDKEFVLPEGIKTCSQDDPNINKCFKETFQEQVSNFKTGVKSLNIVPLDPWEVPRHRLDYSNNGIQLNLVMNNVKVYGMSKALIKNVKSKINNNELQMEIDIFFPEIIMEGTFKANVKFNEMKMRPKGYYNLTMGEISNTASIYGTFEEINGKRHLRVKKFNVNPEIKSSKFFVNGLFADPALDNIAITFVNQYWQDLYKFILVETKSTWEPLLIESTNQFLSTVPIDLLITKTKN